MNGVDSLKEELFKICFRCKAKVLFYKQQKTIYKWHRNVFHIAHNINMMTVEFLALKV